MTYKPLLEPKGKWQTEGIKYLKENPFSILGDDMGLGKTYQALAAFCYDPRPTLIVCPAYLKFNWASEIEAFVPKKIRHLLTVSSYSMSHKIKNQVFERFVFDEAHYLKTLTSKRTIRCFELMEKSNPVSIYLLTGTPIKNQIPEWYSLLRIIHYFRGTDFCNRYPDDWSFNTRFTVHTRKKIRNKGKTRLVNFFEGLQNKSELLSYIKPVMIRRLAKDVLNISEPNFMYNDVKVRDIDDEELLAAFEGKAKDSSAKRKVAIAKAVSTAAYVRGMKEAGKKVVVFSDHPEAADTIYAHVKGKYGLITGAVPANIRQTIVTKFQLGDMDGLIVTIGAGSTGYTMTKANNIIFNDMSWVPEDNSQAIGRLNRIGQDKVVNVHCMTGSPMDRYLSVKIRKKSRIIKETT